MQDTFYLERHEGEAEAKVLRTHTSPVQIRAMQTAGAPLYVIAPGRVYRSDSDATHTPMFHQVEGLVIDRAIHMGHLKWTLETFLKAFFERDDVVLRMRPVLLPFHRSPSAEVDVGYTLVNGQARHRRQRRIHGSPGLRNGPPQGHRQLRPRSRMKWQGFAFGCGIDRLAMLKYGMDDLRAFFDGDIRWLKHYGFRALDVPTLSGGVGRMKFSLSWLKQHLATDADAQTIADTLTAIGLEVEGVENPAEALAPFRVARVLTAEKHPQADNCRC
jgi:phenylalanyl-tRNA synthetase alpha chain